MPDVITQGQIVTLASLHLVYVIVIAAIGWFLLAKPYRYLLIALVTIGWLWSLAAMINFNMMDTGFFSWFFDPAAEKNLTAIATSISLVLIGITALVLFWKTGQHRQSTRAFLLRAYWLLLMVMFCFLAVDEYASIHEGFHYWRQTYLGLGGGIALLTLVIGVWDKDLRPFIIYFLIGLGSLGLAGVLLDAFSTQNIIDIGPFDLTFLRCPNRFLGVRCRDYGNTEELWELLGAIVMWLSLLSITHHRGQQRITHRILSLLVGLWAFVIIGWLWLFPLVENQLARDAHIVYDDITVTGYTVSQERLQAGDTLDVTIYASVNHNLRENYSMSVHLFTQPDATSITQADMELGEFVYPTKAWFPRWPVRNRFTLTVPDDLPAGASYQLVVMLWQGNAMESIPSNSSNKPTLLNNQIMILETIPALSDSISVSPLNGGYEFAEGFTLRGYEIPETIQAGDVVVTRWWWSANNDIDTNLTQFIHITNIETDELFVFDQIPFGGRFPTSDWVADMSEVDTWQFQLPATLPAATYRIATGLYDATTGTRMPITLSNGDTVQDNIIVLGEWDIQ